MRPITPTKSWYPLLFLRTHQTTTPSPYSSTSSCTIFPWVPFFYLLVPQMCSPYEAVSLFAIPYIRGTTTSPAMPRLGDGGWCVCLVAARFGLGPLLLSIPSYYHTNVISLSLARSCLSLCFFIPLYPGFFELLLLRLRELAQCTISPRHFPPRLCCDDNALLTEAACEPRLLRPIRPRPFCTYWLFV